MCNKNQQVEVLYPATFKEKNIPKNIYSARRLPDRIHCRILKCKRCGLVFSSPILPSKEIDQFYKESICTYDEQTPFLTKTYLKIINNVINNLPKNPKILEIGCGNGFLIKELVVRGVTNQIFGVEPSVKMVKKADRSVRKRIKADIFKQNQFTKNSFNLICCFHTLDHMVDPNEFVSESFSLLKGHGYIIVVVHDTDGLSVRLFGERSPIFDVEHIYLFNKNTLQELFERHGFKVVNVFNVFNTYPLSYWWNMSGFSTSIKRVGNYLINNIFRIDKINLTMPAGNIGITAKKI